LSFYFTVLHKRTGPFHYWLLSWILSSNNPVLIIWAKDKTYLTANHNLLVNSSCEGGNGKKGQPISRTLSYIPPLLPFSIHSWEGNGVYLVGSSFFLSPCSWECMDEGHGRTHTVLPSANPIGEIGSGYPLMSMIVIGPCFLH
jgi:hypothetical protein